MPRTPSTRTLAKQLQADYESHKTRLLDALAQCPAGTTMHLRHLQALSDLDRRHREEMREVGLSPERLGAAVEKAWHFVAIVATDGSLSTEPVKPEKVASVLAQNAARMRKRTKDWDTPENRTFREELDAEYPDSECIARSEDEE